MLFLLKINEIKWFNKLENIRKKINKSYFVLEKYTVKILKENQFILLTKVKFWVLTLQQNHKKIIFLKNYFSKEIILFKHVEKYLKY